MKTDKPEPTVAGYIFRANSYDLKPEVLLIRHKKLGLWLPVGGHINFRKDKTPEDAMIREAREEVGLEIILLMNQEQKEYQTTNEIRECASPFYSNIHSVGNHNHYCQYYICEAPGDQSVTENKREISMARWVTEERLGGSSLNFEKNNIAYLAFKKYKEMKKIKCPGQKNIGQKTLQK
jgi:8-oxo-dGTP diphosphatase